MLERIIEALKQSFGLTQEEIKPVEIYQFGKYPHSYIGEPQNIQWRILYRDNDNNRTLLLSEYILDNAVFDTPTIPVGENCDCDVFGTDTTGRNGLWNTCTIRSWLNGYGPSYNHFSKDFTNDNFIQKAFTDEEQAQILKVKIEVANPKGKIVDTCEDRVFFLSIDEANRYFSGPKGRTGRATPYAKRQKVNIERDETYSKVWWWLRNIGTENERAACVDFNGNIFSMGSVAGLGQVGIRPAIWLNRIINNTADNIS